MKRGGIVVCMENLKGRGHLRDIGIDGNILLKEILKKQGVKVWTGLIWISTVTSRGICEHENEPWDYI
jgi:hypothetical protein